MVGRFNGRLTTPPCKGSIGVPLSRCKPREGGKAAKPRGPIHEANIQQFLSYVSCKTKLQGILGKNTLKKYDLQ